MPLYQNDSYSFSVLISVQQTEHLYSSITTRNNCKRLLQGKSGKANKIFTARIATGATKLISITALYKEVGWESLEQRRQTHKLTLFFKMFSHLTPLYLSSLIPPSVSDMSRYNLRNSDRLQTIDSRTNLYYNSFLPSTVRAWIVYRPKWNNNKQQTLLNTALTKTKHLPPNIIILKIEKPKFSILDYEPTVAHWTWTYF